MTTIHVRYEILDDPARPHPDSPADSYPWGVRAVGLPGNATAYGVGNTLEDALEDLSEGVRAALGDGPLPDELTREIAVTVGDAA
jgi:predicted RNase H-like HicB family nuclease